MDGTEVGQKGEKLHEKAMERWKKDVEKAKARGDKPPPKPDIPKEGIRVAAGGLLASDPYMIDEESMKNFLSGPEIKALKDAGLRIPKKMPTGEFVYLYDKSFKEIHDGVGSSADWLIFEWYAQSRAEVARYKTLKKDIEK